MRIRRRISKQFLVAWVLASVGVAGAVGGIASLVPGVTWPLAVSVTVLVGCGIGSGIWAWRTTRPMHLRTEFVEPMSFSADTAFSIEYAADRGTLSRVQDLAAESYGDVPSMPLERYEQFLMVNNKILCTLLDINRQVLGYFDVFPLQSVFANAMMEGLASEHDLRREHLLAEAEAAKAEVLYLGGIAVRDPATGLGGKRASFIIWGLLQYLSAHYGFVRDRTLLACAATREGEQLLQRFQFQLVRPARLTRDGSHLYSVNLKGPAIDVAIANMPDWSHCCRLSWREIPLVRAGIVA